MPLRRRLTPPRPGIAGPVTAGERGHAMSAVVGGRPPVRLTLRCPARTGGRADAEWSELVEGEGALGPLRQGVLECSAFRIPPRPGVRSPVPLRPDVPRGFRTAA